MSEEDPTHLAARVFCDLRGFLVVTLTAGLQGPSPPLFWARTEIRYTVLAFRPESRAVVLMTLAVSASLCSDPLSQYRTWTQDTQMTAASHIHSLIVRHLGNQRLWCLPMEVLNIGLVSAGILGITSCSSSQRPGYVVVVSIVS